MGVADSLEPPRTSAGRTWLGAVGALVVFGALVWAVGPIGLLPGAIIAGLWVLFPGPYAVALGHVVALPVLTEPTVGVLLALEVGFVGVVAAPVVQEREWPVGVGTVAVVAVGLGAIAWLGWRTWEPRWLAALAVVGLVAVGLYGLHRYTVVLLELQGVEHTS